jgi:D-arabinose 1-dehydrogenase
VQVLLLDGANRRSTASLLMFMRAKAIRRLGESRTRILLSRGRSIMKDSSASLPPLSSVVSKVVLGGAGFSTQLHPDPTALPVLEIIQHALKLGFRTFDTSPYYEPSEWLLGDAFSHPKIASQYSRSEIILMTKVGRIAALEFDYSPKWIRYSIDRSLKRFKTGYLDVVFCHDIEYVTETEAVTAVGVLLDFVKEGKIRYVGISGYSIDKLVNVAYKVKQKYGRPLDAVQNWAQLTLQNTKLETEGLAKFQDAGVDCIFNSSPLCIGLLRRGGVPVGSLGDFHPAPPGLREAVLQASDWVESRGETLASLALRYAISRIILAHPRPPGASTIFGGGSIWEIDANAETARMILQAATETSQNGDLRHGDIRDLQIVRKESLELDESLVLGVRKILGKWFDFGFTSPEDGWDVVTKTKDVTGGETDLKAQQHQQDFKL